MTALDQRLAALMAAPKPWRYVVTYADGRQRAVPCLSRAAAENGAEREHGKIGRSLVDVMTGAMVRVVSVSVEPNAPLIALDSASR